MISCLTELAKIQRAYLCDREYISEEGALRWRSESLSELASDWALEFQPGMIVKPNHKGESLNGDVIDWTVNTVTCLDITGEVWSKFTAKP